jgi:hypothetical protein
VWKKLAGIWPILNRSGFGEVRKLKIQKKIFVLVEEESYLKKSVNCNKVSTSHTIQVKGMKGKGTKKRTASSAFESSAEQQADAEAKNETTSAVVPETATTAAKSPLDTYFDNLKSVINRVGAKGSVIIQGVEQSEEEEEETETGKKAKKKKELTAEQVSTLRHFVATERREKAFEKMGKVVLGDQYGDSCMMFNTSFSDEMCAVVPNEIEKIKRKKDHSEQFDLLFALTYVLNKYDIWLTDYEDSDGIQSLLTKLGNTWKKLLAMSNDELKIDPEFTRPAVMKFLEKFTDTVKDAPETFRFKYA